MMINVVKLKDYSNDNSIQEWKVSLSAVHIKHNL